MAGLPLAFASPWILLALGLLPLIWWLLRLTPPLPQTEAFPPLKILARLIQREETPSQSPWWLTLIRLAMAALVIFAMAGPVFNPTATRLDGEGPVLITLDNGWASGSVFKDRRATAEALIREAGETNRTVMLYATAEPAEAGVPLDPQAALLKLESIEARPLMPDHAAFAKLISAATQRQSPGSMFFLSDGLQYPGTSELATALSTGASQQEIILAPASSIMAMAGVRNDPDALSGKLVRAAAGNSVAVELTAHDNKGLPIARQTVTLAPEATEAEFRFSEPVELRNQVVRVSLDQLGNAGGVQLLDDSFRRRLVGLVSGEAGDLSQPLLSPLYYISRALAPFSDLRESTSANISTAIPELLAQGVSAVVLADIGTIPAEAGDQLSSWIEKGGMLIRFAGPRMAAAPEDPLLPVELRRGDRNLDSALSWDTPKALAPFERTSPFFGIEAPRDVTIRRQVLALQDIDLEKKTWATLEDGTPLVTATKKGSGWIVLFHTGSEASWSNLPISGTFVEMLRRVVNQSRSNPLAAADASTTLPPLRLLNGSGELGAPGPEAKPLVLEEGKTASVSFDNPPGFYGTEDGFAALNLFRVGDTLKPLDRSLFSPAAVTSNYAADAAMDIKPWLLMAAALLLALDCLAVLWIAGLVRMRMPTRPISTAALFFAIIAGGAILPATPVHAQQNGSTLEGKPVEDFSATLATRIAYVVTGDAALDDVSRAGLTGLTRFLASRTALEDSEPAAIEISTDELSFYPLIYWPISLDAPIPDAATMARVDAFMKQGGSILFDTRDQIGGVMGGTSGSPEALRLQAILSSLDIPPLQPVPPDHVLTKSFYLLSSFPGRYAGGELWVESLPAQNEQGERPVRAGDGVSSIMITSNDMAAAWAVDTNDQPLFQTIPPDPAQREYAFRVGVNIMMYVLTGNYKADQVHIPALLERLGQ
ncbi:MAG: DUF4159 domain-containing protein [Nitratireductor sp.]